MDVVDVWTGERASALQRALRLTNERFAGKLGTAVRTVANWNGNPNAQPSMELQEALDTLLYEAPKQAQARFALLVTTVETAAAQAVGTANSDRQETTDAARRLDADPNIGAGLQWIDNHAGWELGTARQRVTATLAALDVQALRDRGHRRGRIGRQEVAATLKAIYGDTPQGYGTYGARYGDNGRAHTSVLSHADWLDLRCPLTPPHDVPKLSSSTVEQAIMLDDYAADGAVTRLAETLETNTRIVDAPLYRLLDADLSASRITASFGLSSFVQYALTMDLLEGELIDALAQGKELVPANLPLRQKYLPDVQSVLGTHTRLCAGGALALTAIARPAGNRRSKPDYLLLVQERGGKVLNAASRLAVIPKAFHGPLVDYRDDVRIGATVVREMEEELFGRDDVDGTLGPQRHADPMHPSRLSEPMQWLAENSSADHWQLECTGFGLNLVSGNFEFASLVVIHDESFWSQYGGHIAANWESDSLKQYSSTDKEMLTELIADNSWSNEGLFAFLQGLRRLNEVGGERVDLPTVEWELG